MAHPGHRVDQEKFCCSFCLDLLKDPVTTTCGHSYCRSCINNHWDTQDQRMIYSCPQCRKTFMPRPVLEKNTMLAELVEDLKKTGLQAAPADHCYAGAEDVACDVCTGRKLKAQKSCLQCLVSYCEEHLQPHLDLPAFRTHKLVEPSKKLQENICSIHGEVKKMFCRTDQKLVCYLCSLEQHRGHDTISAEAERTERQRELQGSRQNIQQRIQHRERDMKLLQQEVETINSSADKAVENNEKIFTEMIRLVKQQVRSQQHAEMSRVRELQEKLEQEITELKRKDQELEKLSHTHDHGHFLQDYPSLSQLREDTYSSSISERPLSNYEDVTAAVSELREKLQDVLRRTCTNISDTRADILLLEPEPRTRAEFLRYSQDITLDPNTAYKRLLLSNGNRKVTLMIKKDQRYSDHPDRFTDSEQVLSKDSLTGRCYWEVEVKGEVYVAVSYKSIRRAGGLEECEFGFNNKSWVLGCDKDGYVFIHNMMYTYISLSLSPRVGVYLDHSAGILSFYRISETRTLLHRVQTTFTEPLHAGIGFCFDGGFRTLISGKSSAELCKL